MEDDEEQCEVVLSVQDTTTAVPTTYTLRAMSNWPLRDVLEKLNVGRDAADPEYEVLLHLCRDSWQPLKPEWNSLTLSFLGFEERSLLLVRRKGDTTDAATTSAVVTAVTAAAADDGAALSSPPPPPPPPPAAKRAATGPTVWSTAADADNWDKRSATGFCGLSNQGATCYMNSLLQSLFMTPEFRRAVYEWDFEEKLALMLARRHREQGSSSSSSEQQQQQQQEQTDEEFRRAREEASIPLQLQRLFARMQLGTRRAEKTKKLTKSFGWTGSEAFTQHDAQELCRVLFDSLEQAMAGTHQAQLINELFQGKMTDFCLCTECGKLSARQDVYLDIPLVIKPFGETTAVHSVQEALQRFVQPEILEGANAYFCERCQKRVTAKKGLTFLSFPYILMLQLKRFDFDYQSMRRIKLNDRVEFPHILDLNELLEGDSSAKQKPKEEEKHQQQPGSADTLAMSEVGTAAETPAVSPTPMPTPERPYVYELYAVLVHRGSAFGGHYFAYIQDLSSKKWFEFNDSSVTEITEADIRSSYGEDDTKKDGASWYGANAYMLFYRRIDPARNASFPTAEEIPQALRNLVAGDEQRAAAKAEKKRIERETYEMRCFHGAVEKELKLHKSTTMKVALTKALELFDLRNCALENARLRVYVPASDTLQEPLPADDSTLAHHGLSSYRSLALETREPGTEFAAWDPNKFDLKVVVWDAATTSFVSRTEPATKSDTVGDIRVRIAGKLQLEPERLRILQERAPWDSVMFNNLVDDTKNFYTTWGLYDGLKLWVEESAHARDATIPLTDSQCAMEINRLRSMITVKLVISHPGPTPREVVVPTDKRIALKAFKQQISEVTGLDPSEMQVSYGSVNWKTEMKNTETTLEGHHVRDGMELYIDKGRPTLEGEYRITLNLYSETDAGFTYAKLCEVMINELDQVSEAKKAIFAQLAACPEFQGVQISPERLRLREMYSPTQFPGLPFIDALKVKDCSFLYNTKNLAVQLLDEPEPYTSKQLLLIYVQLWHPSTLKLCRRVEAVLPEAVTVGEFRAWVACHFEGLAVEHIDLAKASRGYFSGISILEAATELEWGKLPETDTQTSVQAMFSLSIPFFKNPCCPCHTFISSLSPSTQNCSTNH